MSTFQRRAIGVIISCVCVSICLTAIVSSVAYGFVETRHLLIAVVVSTLVSIPATLYVTLQERRLGDALRELKSAHQTLEAMHAEIKVKAETDPMTGLFNREQFMKELAQRRRSTDRGTLLIIDADNFKMINDTFGHLAGDDALMAISEMIHTSVREDDVVGRIGGEEFGVILHHAGAENAPEIAERIRVAVERICYEPRRGWRHALTVSIGSAEFDNHSDTSELLRTADMNLYDAKRSGRNRVVLAEAGKAPLAPDVLVPNTLYPAAVTSA